MRSSSVLLSCSLAMTSLACGFQSDDLPDAGVPSPSSSRVFSDDRAALADFGSAVALAGDLLAVGAAGDDADGLDVGAVFLFDRQGESWVFDSRLVADDLAADDHFGSAVAIAGAAPNLTLLIGAAGSDATDRNAGAVYVFEQDGAGWRQASRILASDGENEDLFGSSLSITGAGDGALLAVGARGDDAGARDAGSIYLFERSGAEWVPL